MDFRQETEVIMENKKKKVSVLMYPEMERRIDALFPLHGFSSRSELVCKAVDFYIGFLESEQRAEYMNQTTLAFLQDKLERLESRICKQLFRMCVEMSVGAHISAYASPGVDNEAMEAIRRKCIKDVRNTVGTIRLDSIYAYQNDRISIEGELDEEGY